MLGRHHRFHLPVPAYFVEHEPQCQEDDSEVNGVSRRAMSVELALPHSTFMNVDDGSVDIESAMEKKAAVVLERRKKLAEKHAASKTSAKRAMITVIEGNQKRSRHHKKSKPENDGANGDDGADGDNDASSDDDVPLTRRKKR